MNKVVVEGKEVFELVFGIRKVVRLFMEDLKVFVVVEVDLSGKEKGLKSKENIKKEVVLDELDIF